MGEKEAGADGGAATTAEEESLTPVTQTSEKPVAETKSTMNNNESVGTQNADVNADNIDATNETNGGEQKTASADPSADDSDPSAAPAPSKIADDKKVDRDVSIKTEETATEDEVAQSPKGSPDGSNPIAIVSSNKKSRPPYRYDPDKITLRFLFANRDGLTVTVECRPGDTVGEVKGALLSVWPEDLPSCSGGDRLRLVCMGKGLLMPDSRTLEDCQVPVFKTHPTPVNVSVKPDFKQVDASKNGQDGERGSTNTSEGTPQADQGCACVIL